MRTTGIKPNLQLDKIDGFRADKKKQTLIPVKKENKFPFQTKSMKTSANTKEGKWKF